MRSSNNFNKIFLPVFFSPQKVLPAIATYVRNASDSTDLKAVLLEKVPKEQERVKNFRKAKGSTVVGDVTVDMVSFCTYLIKNRTS